MNPVMRPCLHRLAWLSCLALAVTATSSRASAAASSESLVYRAPDSCPAPETVQHKLRCTGLPPNVTAATLQIEATESGFDVQLTQRQGSQGSADAMHAETCAGAVAWAVFVYNAAFPPGCTLERAVPEPALALTLAAGGTVNMVQSFLPGALVALEAEKWGLRAGVSGTYYKVIDDLRTESGQALIFSQQALTARLCGLTDARFLGTRLGVCGVVDFAFLQRQADALPSAADNTEYWQDFGLAVIVNRSLWAGFQMEAGLGAAWAPTPGKDVAPAGGAGQHPPNEWRVDLGLRIGYQLLGGVNGVVPGSAGARPASASSQQTRRASF